MLYTIKEEYKSVGHITSQIGGVKNENSINLTNYFSYTEENNRLKKQRIIFAREMQYILNEIFDNKETNEVFFEDSISVSYPIIGDPKTTGSCRVESLRRQDSTYSVHHYSSEGLTLSSLTEESVLQVMSACIDAVNNDLIHKIEWYLWKSGKGTLDLKNPIHISKNDKEYICDHLFFSSIGLVIGSWGISECIKFSELTMSGKYALISDLKAQYGEIVINEIK